MRFPLGHVLAEVRGELTTRLGEKGLHRDRVLAAAVRMLDVGVFRAGGEEYAPGDDDEDGTFGLATLRRDHVHLHRGVVLFSYPAKGGVPRTLALRDPMLHKVVNSLPIKEVAEHLGNTPTVARSSYVDPRVIERFDEGRTVLRALQELGNGADAPDLTDDATRGSVERAVVRLIAR